MTKHCHLSFNDWISFTCPGLQQYPGSAFWFQYSAQFPSLFPEHQFPVLHSPVHFQEIEAHPQMLTSRKLISKTAKKTTNSFFAPIIISLYVLSAWWDMPNLCQIPWCWTFAYRDLCCIALGSQTQPRLTPEI